MRVQLPRLSFPSMLAGAAIVLVLSTGTAYAAGQITGSKIKNNSVTGADIKSSSLTGSDIKNSSLTGVDLKDGSLSTADILDGTLTGADVQDGTLSGADVQDGTLSGADVQDNSIGSADVSPLNGDADITDNTISTFDLATDSVDSDEVLDFGLSNQDIGVLFAQVNADGTMFNHSGNVTSTRVIAGGYDVDFGRNVSSCAVVASQGEGGIGGAGGGIVAVTDRAGNTEAAFVTTRNAAGTQTDLAFQIIAVC